MVYLNSVQAIISIPTFLSLLLAYKLIKNLNDLFIVKDYFKSLFNRSQCKIPSNSWELKHSIDSEVLSNNGIVYTQNDVTYKLNFIGNFNVVFCLFNYDFGTNSLIIC